MKTLLATAAALAISSAALAQQPTTSTDMDVQPSGSATMTMHTTLDPTVALAPPQSWNDQQRGLWQQHMSYIPPSWTTEQRTAFQTMMAVPPAQWTPEQRALWSTRYSELPTTWTNDQRAAYQQQVMMYQTPWTPSHHSASAGHTSTMATHHSASADPVHEPSNANPERDARGIAVISAPAHVPAGYNGVAATAMGGPLVDSAGNETDGGTYPACSATVTDNCIQLYERGVRASLDASNSSAQGVGGPYEEARDNTPEDDGLDVDTRPDGSLDVDGDLDSDGDNDIE